VTTKPEDFRYENRFHNSTFADGREDWDISGACLWHYQTRLVKSKIHLKDDPIRKPKCYSSNQIVNLLICVNKARNENATAFANTANSLPVLFTVIELFLLHILFLRMNSAISLLVLVYNQYADC
jgi:hypothetical protein